MKENKNKGRNDFVSENETQGHTSVTEMEPRAKDQNNTIQENSADDELKKIQQELEEQKDKFVRLFAEFDNFKRRNAKEKIELIQTAAKDVISSMLDVLDDCDRAENQMYATDDVEQIRQGVQLVFNKFRNALQSKGLQPMESIHTEFDVHKHEAVAEVPVDDEKLKGKVIDEVMKGYYLNDKIIRFAKVVVGK